MNLKTREQLRELNAQAWADFKAHWPMHVFDAFVQCGGAFALGFALGLSGVIYALDLLA